MNGVHDVTTKQAIAERAYYLWEAGGRPQGSADEDWWEAERQINSLQAANAHNGDGAVDESLKETFPASDPPASHLPDVPPSNAQDKWDAAAAQTES
jgi:hypothetical protein